MVTQDDAALRPAWAPVPGRFPIDPEWIGWGLGTVLSLWLLVLAARAGVPGAILARPATAGVAIATALALLPHPAWAGGGAGGSGNGARVIRFYYQDHLGTDILITTADDTVVSRRVYEPFGRLEDEGLEDGSDPTEAGHHLFTGQRMEGSTGLYDFRARWYDSDSGRFLSVDPIIQGMADPQTHNAYGYVRNNPLNLIDPTGAYVIEGAFLGWLIGFIVATAVDAAVSLAINAAVNAGSGQSPAFSNTRPEGQAETTTSEGSRTSEGGAGAGSNTPRRWWLLALAARLAKQKQSDEEQKTQGDMCSLGNAAGFDDEATAARCVLQSINPTSIKEDKEYYGWIIKEGGRYSATEPKPGERYESNLGPPPPGAVAHYHTHGKGPGGENFTFPEDVMWNEFLAAQSPYKAWTAYLATPGNQFGELTTRTRSIGMFGDRTYTTTRRFTPLYPP